MGKKTTGSFYTPYNLVTYMVDWAVSKLDFLTVLEPSAGDGRFVRELLPYGKEITALEIMARKSRKLRNRFDGIVTRTTDFVDYSMRTGDKYDLIIGNPPYVSKRDLSKRFRRRSTDLVASFGLDSAFFQNLWVSFILGAIRMLNEGGAILYVLPFEFLQVQYAEKLRGFLEECFSKIEIVTFEERVFPSIEQDVCIVLMQDERRPDPVITYRTFDALDSLNEVFCSSIRRNKPLKKWANCIVNDDEMDFIQRLSASYPKIESFGKIAPGVVTGANAYFILNQNEIASRNLKDVCVPIIQKSQDIGDMLIFGSRDHEGCSMSGKGAYLLNTNNLLEEDFSDSLKTYLQIGNRMGIPRRYKCLKRNRWHDVPLVGKGNVSFFKRYGNHPKIMVNKEEIYTTDSAYNIKLLRDFDPYSLVFSFYNSLTLTMCEYNGRFYGGGVCELVPSEFRALPIPYTKVNQDKVTKLDEMFRDGTSISEIVDYVDSVVLNLCTADMLLLKDLRNRYLKRRLKTAM